MFSGYSALWDTFCLILMMDDLQYVLHKFVSGPGRKIETLITMILRHIVVGASNKQ